MTNIQNILAQLGFSKNEITVYLALFDLGKCKAGEIIDYTKLHRNLVYTALDEFVKRELVTKTESRGISTFVANDPSRLIEEIDQKRELAQQAAEEMKKRQEESPREISIYEGVEGIKRIREHSLQIPGVQNISVLGISALSSIPELEQYWKSFHKRRIARGINAKMFFDRTTDENIFHARKSLPLTEAKYLPFQEHFPVWFEFYGDELNIGLPSENPLIFRIKSKEAVTAFETFFEYLWNQEVTVVRGVEALKKAFYAMIDEVEPEGEYNVLGAYALVSQIPYLDPIFEAVHKYRIAKKVHVKMLIYKEFQENMRRRFQSCGDPQFIYSHARPYLTESPSPFQINLYNGKAMMIFYGEEPTIISFEKSEVYQGFKSYFDELWNQEFHILRGPTAVRDIWLESIDTGELKFIGAKGYFVDRYPEMFAEIKKKAATGKNIQWKNIVDPSFRGHTLSQLSWMKTKYTLPPVKNPNVIWLYGNKVAVAGWTEEEPVVFVSENKQVVQSYNDYFDELWNRETQTLSGYDGIVELCERVLEEGQDLYLIAVNGYIMETHEKYYQEFTKRRIQKNIKLHILADENAHDRFKNIFLSEIKYLPPEFGSPMVVWIFGDYVAHVLWQEPQTVFLLHEKKVAEYYRNYYEALKKIAKR